MTRKKMMKGLTAMVVGLFITLSLVSGYSLISPFEVDLDLSLMLTPYGIIKNLFFSPTPLTPYYFVAPEGELPLKKIGLVLTLISLELCTFRLLANLRRSR